MPADNRGDRITDDCIAVVYFVKVWALSLLSFISLFRDELLFGLSKPMIIDKQNTIVKIRYMLLVKIRGGIISDENNGAKKPILKP